MQGMLPLSLYYCCLTHATLHFRSHSSPCRLLCLHSSSRSSSRKVFLSLSGSSQTQMSWTNGKTTHFGAVFSPHTASLLAHQTSSLMCSDTVTSATDTSLFMRCTTQQVATHITSSCRSFMVIFHPVIPRTVLTQMCVLFPWSHCEFGSNAEKSLVSKSIVDSWHDLNGLRAGKSSITWT